MSPDEELAAIRAQQLVLVAQYEERPCPGLALAIDDWFAEELMLRLLVTPTSETVASGLAGPASESPGSLREVPVRRV